MLLAVQEMAADSGSRFLVSSRMGETDMPTSAERLWTRDLDQIEGEYLDNRRITDLPIRTPDGRTPSQGSVLTRYVDVDRVVCKPTWLGITLGKLRCAICGWSK